LPCNEHPCKESECAKSSSDSAGRFEVFPTRQSADQRSNGPRQRHEKQDRKWRIQDSCENIPDHLGYPTLPSSEIEINFCASTANSIGSCCSTSLTNPLTTRPTASSWLSPRWMQ